MISLIQIKKCNNLLAFTTVSSYNKGVNQGENPMKYMVKCDAAPFENTSTDDLNRAYDLCLDLSMEYGRTEIVTYNGLYQQLVAEYTWGR